MDPTTIVKLVIVLGIVLVVLAIGIRAGPVDPSRVLSDPWLAARAMASMFVVMPLFVLLLVALLPLRPGVGAALLALSVSPMLPPWAKQGLAVGGKGDFILGLQGLATCVSVVAVPAMIWLVRQVFQVDTPLTPWALEQVLLVTVVVPLAAGMGLAQLWPGAAPRIAARCDRVGLAIILLGVAVVLVGSARAIVDVLGRGTLVAAAVVVGVGLLVGHLLGGPEPGNRGALATATAARHPGVGLVLATSALPESQPAILATVLLYLLASILLTIPYQRWRREVVARG